MRRGWPPLGDLEHELLTLLWAKGEMTAAQMGKQLSRTLKDATVRTVLRRLEDKGYVMHSVQAGTFFYRPKESADAAAAQAVRAVIEKFCGGSIELALHALANAVRVEPRQLARIAGNLKHKAR